MHLTIGVGQVCRRDELSVVQIAFASSTRVGRSRMR